MSIFPQLFESVPDALVVVGADGRIVMANRHAARLFGYDDGGLVGRPIEDLVPEHVRERHRGYRDGYMRQPRVRPMGAGGMTLVGRRRDGQEFPVEIALSPLETDEGVRFLASVRDVSETLRARQQLARARYDALVGRIGELAIGTAGEDAVEAVPGLLAEALQVPAVVVLAVRGGKPVIRAALGLAGGAIDGAQWRAIVDVPLRAVLASGRALTVEEGEAPGWPPGIPSGAIVPLIDRDRPMGALVALSDQPRRFDHDALQLLQTVGNLLASMAQRRHAEEQLAHAQRLDAIGQLTGGVAHDFNNLLTVMSGSLQLLETECAASPGARDIITGALRSVERGAELTSKLLAFARRQHLTPRAIDPGTRLADLAMMLRGTLGDGIRLEATAAPGLPPVFADPAQLDNALVNLALNARDAMPDGGVISIRAEQRPTALASAKAAGDYVVFSVDDTGRGMTPDVLSRAFEPFFTTKAIGRGSGLGLSMVYGFVTQSGGRLDIDSEPGRGTRVALFLPVAAAGDATAPADVAVPELHGTEEVLVVEDEPEVRHVAAAFLRALGYRVVAVGTAAEALEQLARHEGFALLFTDVMLGGGMNGIELAHAARSLRPGLAVLLASGYDEPALPGNAAPGAFALLRKPYRREQLAASVWSSLRA